MSSSEEDNIMAKNKTKQKKANKKTGKTRAW